MARSGRHEQGKGDARAAPKAVVSSQARPADTLASCEAALLRKLLSGEELEEFEGSTEFQKNLPDFVVAADGALLYAGAGFENLTLPRNCAVPGKKTGEGSTESLADAAKRDGGVVLKVGGRDQFFQLRETWLDQSDGEKAILGYLVSDDTSAPAHYGPPAEDQRAAERFADVADLVSDWIWETDAKRRLTYVSPRVTEVLGYHAEELVGRRIDVLSRNAVPAEMLDADAPTPFHGWRASFSGKQGEQRSFLFHGRPFYDRVSGAFQGFRGTAQDVTDLIAQEASLRQVIEAADAASRAKSEFLANTSHELRTPLNAIIGFTEVMDLEKFGPLGNPRYKEYVSDVLGSARHLLSVINDILDVAKIEAGKLELAEEDTDPASIARQSARLVADRAAHLGLKLCVAVPEGLPSLRLDERKIRQVLVNLLANAVKFTGRGGEVHLTGNVEDDGRFLFQVRDTGIGIAPEDLAVALAPFGQADSQLSRRFEGTGLGLPLSHALVKLHGGSLQIDSKVKVGTTVRVVLPSSRVVPR